MFALAVILVSCPVFNWSWPSARRTASRALLRASIIAEELDDARSEMVDRLSNPTAMTVSKIINERVTIRAKPLSRRGKRGMFKGFMGFQELGLHFMRRGHAERCILVPVSIQDLLGGGGLDLFFV